MKKLLISLLVLVFVAIAGVTFVGHRSGQAYANDCDSNAIIYCGVENQADLRDKYQDNTTHDLPAVYSHYGISKSMITDTKAVPGFVYKNGDVRVSDKIVATNAQSVGRQSFGDSKKVTINGKTYYQRDTETSFKADRIAAMVFLNSDGKFVAAVLHSCGNPVIATPKPKPVYQCKALAVTRLDRDSFRFNADAVVKDATFKYFTYVVKDANGKVIDQIKTTSGGSVDYTAKQTGQFTVEALTTVEINGKLATAPVGDCKKSFTVEKELVAICKSLIATPVAGRRDQITFAPTAQLENVTLKDVTYTVKNTAGAVVGTPIVQTNLNPYTYTQATAGAYSVAAVITVAANGKDSVAAGTCQANFTIPEAPVYECKNLDVSKLGDTRFMFVTTVNLPNTTFKSVTYTIKNATGDVVNTITRNDLNAYLYTQTAVGPYQVTALVTVTVNGQDATATGTCAAGFEVTPPPAVPAYECKAFTSTLLGEKNAYKFVVSYTATGGAQLSGVTVDFIGDGKNTTPYALEQLGDITHTYTTAGDYVAKATLSFIVNGNSADVRTATCEAKITVSDFCVVPGKETLPVNSPDCYAPCVVPGHETERADAPTCKGVDTPPAPTPTVLPNTGIGGLVGIFGGASAIGAIAHRKLMRRKR